MYAAASAEAGNSVSQAHDQHLLKCYTVYGQVLQWTLIMAQDSILKFSLWLGQWTDVPAPSLALCQGL